MQGRASLQGRRVLVVEDEAVEALMLESLLAEAGCIVVGPTGTAEAALTLIEQKAIDCAVLDVKLLDGQVFSVADTLAVRGVPFVFATAYQAEALGARYAGVPHIEKVYDRDELLDTIALILVPDPHAA